MSILRKNIPFFRPEIAEEAIEEVVVSLRSGWLTSGPRVQKFEELFAEAVGARYAVAVNSCTAALHLAVEALGLKPGQGVLVPTMTFAATAEVVRYQGAIPLLVDCDPVTGNMSLDDAVAKIGGLLSGRLSANVSSETEVVGMIPVHVGGAMMDVGHVREFASNHDLWLVDDAAHAFPSAWKNSESGAWQRCGEQTADISCFSFYANKTITTGEGGMAVTNDADHASRMRMMSNHGLSTGAWERGRSNGNWDYRILAPGYKYNLSDVAAALGIHQLSLAESMRRRREEIARRYIEGFREVSEIGVPEDDRDNRVLSWHLFPIRLDIERLSINRNEFLELLRQQGIGSSVHWRPLHLHPYYQETLGWQP